MFSVGDFVVEQEGGLTPAFGVVIGFDNHDNLDELLLHLQYPTEQGCAFASQCLPYGEWLRENSF